MVLLWIMDPVKETFGEPDTICENGESAYSLRMNFTATAVDIYKVPEEQYLHKGRALY